MGDVPTISIASLLTSFAPLFSNESLEAVVRREVLEKEVSIQAAALSAAQSENAKLQTRLAEAQGLTTSLASDLQSLREREAAHLKIVGEDISALERLSEAERALGKAENEAILLRGAR